MGMDTTGNAWLLVGIGAAMMSSSLTFGSSSAAPLPDCFGREATVVGTAGSDRLVGTPGDDVIVAGGGGDTIFGRAGRDMVCGEGGPDLVRGGKGPDTLLGQHGDDILAGDRSVDVIVGGIGADTISGGRGAFDLLNGEAGNDTLNGGPGFDMIVYYGASRGVNVDLKAGIATGHGSDQIAGVEGIDGSVFDDTLAGNARQNVLFGDSGNDHISGRAEEGAPLIGDFIDGGPGHDAIDGGLGFDTVSFQNAQRRIIADLSTGTSTGHGSDTLTNVEGLFGNGRADTLIGDDEDNAFWGQRGDDTLDGRGGSDVVSFGTFFGRPGPVVANLSTGNATGVGDDTLIGIEDLFGTSEGDTLVGNDTANELAGLTGDDSISAAAGDDTLRGGPGEDGLDGGGGIDECRGGETELNCEVSALAQTFGPGLPPAVALSIRYQSSGTIRAAVLTTLPVR